MTQCPAHALTALDRQYANHARFPNGDEWTERNIVRASPSELQMLLQMQPCFVYRLSLEAVAPLARPGPVRLSHVRNAIHQLLTCDGPVGERPPLDGTLFEWKGVRERMTRRAWLVAMLAAIDKQVGPADSSLSMQAAAAAASSAAGAAASVVVMSQTVSTEWYLPDLRPGQFQLPHLWTCGSLVQIGVRNSVRRQYTPDAPLHVVEFSGQSYGDTAVTYLGEELRTGDMEVWGQLLKLATPLPLGSRVTVSAKELLTALGRGTGGPAYKSVRGEIARLQGARLAVRSSFEPMRQQFRAMFPDDPLSQSSSRGPIEVSFQLLGPSSTDGRMWSVSVPREVRVAFGPRLSSWFSEREYGLLTRRREGDTVRRLYLLYRSHVRPWPFTVQELRRYLGSTMGRDSDLKAALDTAHDRLTSSGLIKAWRYGSSDRRRNCPDRVYAVDF